MQKLVSRLYRVTFMSKLAKVGDSYVMTEPYNPNIMCAWQASDIREGGVADIHAIVVGISVEDALAHVNAVWTTRRFDSCRVVTLEEIDADTEHVPSDWMVTRLTAFRTAFPRLNKD